MLKKVNWVADYIVNKLNKRNIMITHLKLQKLLYFCQKEFLKRYDMPLFNEDFEAWIHGPVLPIIYKEYAKFGWDNIPAPRFPLFPLNKNEKETIKFVLEKYQNFSGKELENLTHQEYSWIEARKGLLFYTPSKKIISKKCIRLS